MTNILQTFAPDWVSPPGETIEELRQEKGLSEADLAWAAEAPHSGVAECRDECTRVDDSDSDSD